MEDETEEEGWWGWEGIAWLVSVEGYNRGSAARGNSDSRARRARRARRVAWWRTGGGGKRGGKGMKMQKGAGGLAQYRCGGASAFILFFVRRRVARFRFSKMAAPRSPMHNVGNPGPLERVGNEGWYPTLPIGKGTRRTPSATWRVSRSPSTRGCSETSILVCEISEILYP